LSPGTLGYERKRSNAPAKRYPLNRRRFEEYGFPLYIDDRIIPEDKSTLFICSGMQRVGHKFTSPDGSVYGSLQSCVRTNDLGLAWIAHRALERGASRRRQVAADNALATPAEARKMATDCPQQLTLWNLGTQQVTVDFDGGRVVSDAGLLAIRQLDKTLGVLAELASRLPDPRAQKYVTHSGERLLTQQVYQILAGYPDCNDAQQLRADPLFQTLADLAPDGDQALASGSTLARFQQAYTRRDAELPPEERPVLREVDAALTRRLKLLNDYLPELFMRTRRTPPAFIIIDLDPTDDPTHGQQILTGFHGYFEQHQYFPLFAFDGTTGFPWRPGCGRARSTPVVGPWRPCKSWCSTCGRPGRKC
jgi:hypothetical protein